MANVNRFRRGLRMFFLALLAVTASLLLLSVCFIAVWSATSRPSVTLDQSEVTVKAGETFSKDQVGYTILHARTGDLTIDDSRVDLKRAGDYTVRYQLRKSALEKLVEHFSPNPSVEADLTVHVVDTDAPSITLKKDTVVVGVGSTLKVEDLVKSASDSTEVTTTFEDGKTEMKFDAPGTENVKVLATDTGGNQTSSMVTVIVKDADLAAPVILGAEYTVVRTGDAFDVMSGVSVTDNSDDAPQLAVEPQSVDTSQPGDTTLTYTATDALGNTSTVQRVVTVSSDVAQYQGKNFAILWDASGVTNQPYLVAVNRQQNVVTVYQQDSDGRYTVPVQVFLCSTGTDTPVGRFTTEERYRWQTLYDDSFGQYATRINGHILFHSVPYFTENPADLESEEFNKLGTTASLGCVRLCVADAKWIYDNCPDGFPCVIYDDANSPGPMGKPEGIQIDLSDTSKKGWDPTDPDPSNPYLTAAATSENAGAGSESKTSGGEDADGSAGTDGGSDSSGRTQDGQAALTAADVSRILNED